MATQHRFGHHSQWNRISKLERTQRRATKYILNLPFSTAVDYKSRLRSLNLLPVSYWHEYLDLILFFKITHGLVTLNPQVSPAIFATRRTTRSTSSNKLKYVIPKCRTTTYQKSFLVRACRVWNYLADELNFTKDTSISVFKSDLLKYYFTSLNINYDPENSRTFKSICLKCNCIRSLHVTSNIVLQLNCKQDHTCNACMCIYMCNDSFVSGPQ